MREYSDTLHRGSILNTLAHRTSDFGTHYAYAEKWLETIVVRNNRSKSAFGINEVDFVRTRLAASDNATVKRGRCKAQSLLARQFSSHREIGQ